MAVREILWPRERERERERGARDATGDGDAKNGGGRRRKERRRSDGRLVFLFLGSKWGFGEKQRRRRTAGIFGKKPEISAKICVVVIVSLTVVYIVLNTIRGIEACFVLWHGFGYN